MKLRFVVFKSQKTDSPPRVYLVDEDYEAKGDGSVVVEFDHSERPGSEIGQAEIEALRALVKFSKKAVPARRSAFERVLESAFRAGMKYGSK